MAAQPSPGPRSYAQRPYDFLTFPFSKLLGILASDLVLVPQVLGIVTSDLVHVPEVLGILASDLVLVPHGHPDRKLKK